jgi:hypothetical protein
VETGNPSAYATVDCGLAIALHACNVIKSGCNQRALIKSNHPN